MRKRMSLIPDDHFDVVINIQVNDIAEGVVYQRHVEEDVTFSFAMDEAKRRVEYMGSDNVKSVCIDFKKR